LRDWSLPSRGVKTLKWPRDLAPLASQALERVRGSLTAAGLGLWDWVRARTRVVQAARRNHAGLWNHIRTAKGASMVDLLSRGGGLAPPPEAEQRAMVRVKRYWKLPVLDSPGHELRRGEAEVRAWARRNFGREYRDGGPGCQAREEGCAPPLHWQDCSQERETYARSLSAARLGEVLVQEDKDKCAAWRMPESLYLRWMAALLVADPVHWTHVDCTVGEVRRLFRLLHWELMPVRLRYMALPARWAGFGLNYMYMNLKAKCFGDGVGRVCTKPGHSCMRKVVSWRSHPAVDYYRWLARAVQVLVKSWGRAYEVTSLKTAAAELRRKVAVLEGSGNDEVRTCRCRRSWSRTRHRCTRRSRRRGSCRASPRSSSGLRRRATPASWSPSAGVGPATWHARAGAIRRARKSSPGTN